MKALLLTADENHPVSSSGFIGVTDGTGSIDATVLNGIPASSNVIAMTFDEGTGPDNGRPARLFSTCRRPNTRP